MEDLFSFRRAFRNLSETDQAEVLDFLLADVGPSPASTNPDDIKRLPLAGREEVFRTVQSAAPRDLTVQDVLQTIGDPRDRPSVKNRLRELAEAGHLERVARGRYRLKVAAVQVSGSA
ncbi:MAG: hypothetical protein AAF661_15165 [Pseudomonadota bacterium]